MKGHVSCLGCDVNCTESLTVAFDSRIPSGTKAIASPASILDDLSTSALKTTRRESREEDGAFSLDSERQSLNSLEDMAMPD